MGLIFLYQGMGIDFLKSKIRFFISKILHYLFKKFSIFLYQEIQNK